MLVKLKFRGRVVVVVYKQIKRENEKINQQRIAQFNTNISPKNTIDLLQAKFLCMLGDFNIIN